MKVLLLSIFFLVIYCSEEDTWTDQEKEKNKIDKLSQELVDMAEASDCSEEYSCEFVGIGSNPSGEHRKYLVYSTSIDEESFLEKANELEELEKAYNKKYGIVSDCMVVSPPKDVICEDGKCVGIYD